MKKMLAQMLGGFCLLILVAACNTTREGPPSVRMPFSKDRIESRYERKAAEVFAAAKIVLADMGTLVGENTISNTLIAKMDNNTIWVRVTEIEPGISKVTTNARRKSTRGNVDLASEVDKRIALELQIR